MLKMILDRESAAEARRGWEAMEGLLTRFLYMLLAVTSHGRHSVSA